MSISGLIEQHVLARPEAIALTYGAPGAGGTSLGYRELSLAANRLAAHLVARGVRPGDRVATVLPAGPELVTAWLAVLRAGASYVALDPGARPGLPGGPVRAVVTSGRRAAEYAGLGAEVVALDAEAGQIAARPGALPGVAAQAQAQAQESAYLREVLALAGPDGPLRVRPGEGVGQVAAPDEDTASLEVWAALTAGARLVGLDADTVADPGRLEAALREGEVSVLLLPGADFERTARERPAAFDPLHTLAFGGPAACDPQLLRQVLHRAGSAPRLLHLYGTPAAWHEAAAPDAVCAGAPPATPPGTPVQEIVRDLFAEAAGVPRSAVHADSDFFRLGGGPAAAARLLARTREVLDADPGGGALGRAPTPALFAALVGDGPAAATGPGRAAAAGSAVLPLRLRGPLDTDALDEALKDLGRRHEALRNSRLGSAGTRLRSLAAAEHLLELMLPGDAVDLWSHAPLAAELALAYGARARGDAPRWPTAAPQGAQRALFGDAEPTAVPGSGPYAGDAEAGHLAFALDAGLHAQLAALAAEQGVTLFMLVHAALAALLTRLGAGPVVTVAAPVPARDSAALRRAVGPYGRVLALSVDASGDPAFTELLRRVRAADLAAYRDGEAALALPGGVALTVLQETAGAFAAGALTVEAAEPRLPSPTASLGLTLTERHDPEGEPAGIAGAAAFPYEAIGEAAAASLTRQLVAVLEAAVETPDSALSRLRLLPGAEPVDAVGLWSGVGRELPAVPAQSVASLFAEQVARTPGAAALGGMDYAELDARSDLLAHVLLEHEAGPGTCVVTAIASPTGFAVAALAVAKAGAACMPLDPALGLPAAVWPAVLLLDEAADRALAPVPRAVRLVRAAAADQLPAGSSWPVRAADRTRPLDPDAPVLLAHTAHATIPTAATIAIGGERLSAAAAGPGPAADAAWLVPGYPDAEAALGLLRALVGGARVHLPGPALTHGAPHEVLQWLREQGASVVLGPADDALVALARAQDTALTVSSGWPEGRLLVERTPGGRTRPAPGYRAYVLDAQLRPVAAGAVGALYIGGVGVAQGYAGLPGATGERFLPDPLAGPGDAAARMWRTGHAARVDEDGSLHVLDHPCADDPFADEFATFVVVADGAGHRALWPARVPLVAGWHETHSEDVYELCLDHLNDHLNDRF
ncbi:AMP-binding protein [Streptomyces sp. NPDC044571]|uniref:AMP-binding protein n=1 Tax=Streptomyces sp. NPDC044571 TaxID=3155371 RepID=UPI0033C5BC14